MELCVWFMDVVNTNIWKKQCMDVKYKMIKLYAEKNKLIILILIIGEVLLKFY